MIAVKKIVVPTDFSEPSQEGFRKARQVAEHFGAELLVVHVTAPMPIIPAGHGAIAFNVADYRQEIESVSKKRLEEFVAGERAASKVAMTPLVREGEVAEEIVQAGRDHDADLIVIATHGYSGWKKLILGSVTEKVVRMASLPVLTINAPSDKAK